jgi:hypothetical protein
MRKHTIEWLQSTLSATFADKYLVDGEELEVFKDQLSENNEFPAAKLWMSLEDDAELFIKIYPHMLIQNTKNELVPTTVDTEGITCMCALFTLVQAIESKLSDGSLESVEALLTAPLIMFEDVEMEVSCTFFYSDIVKSM